MNWYKEAKIDQTEVKALEKNLMEKHPGLDLALWISNVGYVELAVIEVPKDLQGLGIGHEVVEEVKQFAQSVGLPVVLRPSANTGKKQKLERFYKDLGFVQNKGKNTDYRLTSPISPTMYWKPSQEKQAQADPYDEPPEWSFPEADHDYNPDWDYEVDPIPDQKLVQIAEDAMKEINTRIIPQIGIGVCKAAYIKGTNKKELARYISGTEPNPVFVVDLQIIKDTAEECARDYDCNPEMEIMIGIRSTLFHELGHAIQEYLELEYDEDEAEEFAREYQSFGKVWKFWEE